MAIVVCSLSHFVVIQMSVNKRKHEAISQQYDLPNKTKNRKTLSIHTYLVSCLWFAIVLAARANENTMIKREKSQKLSYNCCMDSYPT